MWAKPKKEASRKGLTYMENKRLVSSICLRESKPFALALLLILSVGTLRGLSLYGRTPATPNKQPGAKEPTLFSTPEEAMQAISEAVRAKNRDDLTRILGSDADQLLSGDAVEDNKDLEDFASAVQESAELRQNDEAKYTLVVGKNHWPFPIPIAKQGDQWRFDTKVGMDEILNRRIGDNELSAIATCRAYAVAQWEYYTEGDWDHDSVAEYAQKFRSSPGQHDGLFWDTSESEKPSPLGKLVAAARAEGYGPRGQTQQDSNSNEPRSPYHGYYFRILTRQGPHAPGGKYSYVINGNMIAGYALVAYPAKWGNSGVMTFIINQQGRVYEKNLGSNTAKIASAMGQYDPDPSWKLAEP